MRTCKRFSDDILEHLWDDWEILDNLSYEIYTKRSDVWGLHQVDFVICLRIIWNCVEELHKKVIWKLQKLEFINDILRNQMEI